jgi:hypothetical protein
MVAAPFAEFTWRYARRLAAEKGRDDTNETEVARVLDELLTRAEAGPVDKLTDRITGRARTPARADDTPSETPGTTGQDSRDGPLVTVIPFGVFDADAEAEKWL